MEKIIEQIKTLFKNHFPNYPVIAIWDSGDSYLVSIGIKSGSELMDGYIKVDKNDLQIEKNWGYQKNLSEFKKIFSTPAIYVNKEVS